MADDVTLPGTGEVVATDDIGGRQFQLVKVVHGANGIAHLTSDGNPMPTTDAAVQDLLLRLLSQLVSPVGYDKSLGRSRNTAVIESGTVTTVTTVSTVTTCTTVSSLSNIAAVGGYNAQMQIMDTNRTAWAQCVRSCIT